MVEKDMYGQWLTHNLWIPKNHWVVQNCALPTREKRGSCTYLKLKTSALWKALFREWKHKPDFEKNLCKTHLMQNWYPKYTDFFKCNKKQPS